MAAQMCHCSVNSINQTESIIVLRKALMYSKE